MKSSEALEQEREVGVIEQLRNVMLSLRAVQGRVEVAGGDPVFDEIIDVLTHTQHEAMCAEGSCEGEAWQRLRRHLERLYDVLHGYMEEDDPNEAEWRHERNIRWRQNAIQNAMAPVQRGLKARQQRHGRFEVEEWADVCMGYKESR